MLMTANNPITFFKTEAAALAIMAKGEMTAEDGVFVVPAKGRPGYFVIEVRDTDDGTVLGNL
jgi:hypothetical protein